MVEKEIVRTRYAPSPTGIPHVGNIRTAMFAEDFVRSKNGVFILRIEDTDQARKVPGAIEAIKESLEWLNIKWDEYAVQSERLPKYQSYAQELVDNKLASKEENGAIRFNVPKDPPQDVSWVDAIGNRKIPFTSENVENFVILKADGYPTYHLANVIDDHEMGITHVIRGDDWVSSTPKHILLYRAFGWEQPIFAHVPNVLGPDGKKLSKRDGAKSVLDFKKEGYLPEALRNALMLLGWSPGDDLEIFSQEIEVEKFSLERVNVAPAMFDQHGKLESLNMHYITNMENQELADRLIEFDVSLEKIDRDLILKLIPTAKTRIKTLADFKNLVEPFISDTPVSPNPELKSFFLSDLARLEDWNLESIMNVMRKVMEEKKVKVPDIYEAIIGVRRGINIPEVFAAIGKEATLERFNK